MLLLLIEDKDSLAEAREGDFSKRDQVSEMKSGKMNCYQENPNEENSGRANFEGQVLYED